MKNYFSVMIRAADMDNILAAEAKIIEALDEKYGLVEGSQDSRPIISVKV